MNFDIIKKNSEGIHRSSFPESPIINKKLEKQISGLGINKDEMIDKLAVDLVGKENLTKEKLELVKQLKDKIKADTENERYKLAEALESTTLDHRFMNKGVEIANKDYVRYEMKNILDVLTDISTDKELFSYNLSRYARVAMDVNGLKPVNDLAGHENGDMFLLQISDVLTKDDEILKFASENNLLLIPSSEGGDEFGFFLEKIDGEIEDELIANFCALVKKRIEDIYMGDILDFNSELVKKNLQKFELVTPENYQFKPSMAVGFIRLKEAFLMAEEEAEKIFDDEKIEESEKYEKILNVIMGACFKSSDTECTDDKNKRKKALSKSNIIEDRFTYRIIQRTKETMKLVKEIQEKNDLIESMKREIQQKNDLIGLQEKEKEINEEIGSRRLKINQLAKILMDMKKLSDEEMEVWKNTEKEIEALEVKKSDVISEIEVKKREIA